MLAAASGISKQNIDIQFLIAMASDRNIADVKKANDAAVSQGLPLPGILKVVDAETYDALNAADAAAVTSGTATLEAGIIGTPMAIVYKTSALNYKLFEPIIEKLTSNNIEAKTLAEIRDSLLPRLISGKIRVGEFEKESSRQSRNQYGK